MWSEDIHQYHYIEGAPLFWNVLFTWQSLLGHILYFFKKFILLSHDVCVLVESVSCKLLHFFLWWPKAEKKEAAAASVTYCVKWAYGMFQIDRSPLNWISSNQQNLDCPNI